MNSERGAVQQQLSGIDGGFVTRCATASGHIGDLTVFRARAE